MKTLAISLAFASLFASATATAYESNEQRESSLQAQKFHVAAAPSMPDQGTNKNNIAADTAKSSETNNTLPDPKFMPYVSGSYCD
jgi:hypothetical protein